MIEATPYLIDKKKEITSIQFIIRIKGQRLRFVPGISVVTKYWIDNQKWCKENKQYPDGYLNNIQIRKYKDIIENVIQEFQKQLIIPTQQTFKKAVQAEIDNINYLQGGVVSEEKQKEIEDFEKTQIFLNFATQFADGCDRKPSTKRIYKTVINKLKQYEQDRGIILKFTDINMIFYNDLKKYLIEDNLSKNYIGAIFKNIILFMGEAKEQNLCDFVKPKGFVVESEVADTISLSEDEIRKIKETEITAELALEYFPEWEKLNINKILKRLNTERDRFIIGYCTALRISDYSRIDGYDIKDGIISIWTVKKDKKIYIPLHHYMRDIIGRYDNLKIPKISDQKHNDHLKDLCQILGINDPVKKTITKGGKRIEFVEPKYKFVTSHTARRSGATNMYRNGIELLYISRLLGHKNIEQTIDYLKLNTKELAIRMKNNPYFTGKEE